MTTHFATLHTLDLAPGHAAGLGTLGIHTIGDVLAFSPFRHARAVAAALDGSLRRHEVDVFLVDRAQGLELDRVLDEPTTALRVVDAALASRLAALGLDAVGDLARYAPFDEAEDLVASYVDGYRDPDAPRLVVPQPRKFTRNSKSFVSFTKQQALRGLDIRSEGDSLLSQLFWFSEKKPAVIHLGHAVTFRQDWIFQGNHLGEPRGSVNLFMGQDTQVSVLDWRRAVTAVRTEDSTTAERLASTLFHQRAVDEVARATAEEHQFGSTSIFGANAAASGSFVVAGAVLGGVGGGVTGSAVGFGLDVLTGGATGGLGTLGGAVIGTAVGSMVGAAAGSLVTSGATTLGFVESDARGAREVVAGSAQHLTQRTTQNSSSIRSFWSNIIAQNLEEEQQTVRTDRVTNHNRIHALNALYFEVLNDYRVTLTPTEVRTLLFLPFRPISFDEVVLERYWWLIRTVIDDLGLVEALDPHFTSLTSAPSPGGPPIDLPRIEDIVSADIEIRLNLDGTKMAEVIESFSLGLLGDIAEGSRDEIVVSLVTDNGDIVLPRRQAPDAEPNLIGTYGTARAVPIHTITGVRVRNDNDEFLIAEANGNKLHFEDLLARVEVRDRQSFAAALPQLGRLETQVRIGQGRMSVPAQQQRFARWDIGDRLREQFERVDQLRAAQEAAAAEVAALEARLQRLLGFLNANTFTFTRLILEATERPQLTRALEGVRIGGIELSQVASTDPVGFAGEHVVLAVTCERAEDSTIGVDTRKLETQLARVDRLERGDRAAVTAFFTDLGRFIDDFVLAARGQGNGSSTERRLFVELVELRRLLATVGPGLRQTEVFDAIAAVRRAVRAGTRTDNLSTLVCDFHRQVLAELTTSLGVIAEDDEVSLPSPAVFMEPVLSHAKGAELYDVRRNSHYELLTAPGIGEVDPNVLRSRPIDLAPTETTPVLDLLQPPELTLPNSLGAALAEAGKLDLSALLSNNATTLTSTLGRLADVATEMAKASSQLTGDAQEQALQAASDLAGKVADAARASAAAPAPKPAPAAPAPAPPPAATTSRGQAERVREVTRVDGDASLSPAQRTERKQVLGVPTVRDPRLDYTLSVHFLDDLGVPITGQYDATIVFTPLEQNSESLLNGTSPFEVTDGSLRMPETFLLTPGRKVQLDIAAQFGTTLVPGLVVATLPATPDLVFQCRMLTETVEVVERTSSRAVDTRVASSGFGAGAEALFEHFMSSQLTLPYRLAEVVGAGSDTLGLDLRSEYNASSSSTDEEDEEASSQRTFRVTTPLNGWAITLL